jgi:hypothetical protein
MGAPHVRLHPRALEPWREKLFTPAADAAE